MNHRFYRLRQQKLLIQPQTDANTLQVACPPFPLSIIFLSLDNSLLVLIHTSGWREALRKLSVSHGTKNTIQLQPSAPIHTHCTYSTEEVKSWERGLFIILLYIYYFTVYSTEYIRYMI